MKKMVFIVGSYYPRYSAIGKCISNVADSLKQSYDITVISAAHQKGSSSIIHNCEKLIYICTAEKRGRITAAALMKSENLIVRNAGKFLLLTLQIYRYLSTIIMPMNINNSLVNAYYEALLELQSVDIIVPACLPVEGIVASIRYKREMHNATKVVPILFDKFSVNQLLHRGQCNTRRKFSRHLALEKDIFRSSDMILYTDSWDDHISKYLYAHREKCVRIEHPLIKEIRSKFIDSFDHTKLNIVYTGALYKGIRSPLKALEMISQLIDANSQVVAHFYIVGDCGAIVSKYSSRYPNNIINYGSVNTDIATHAIKYADILLSIGNTDVTQFPSKIFEYISTGNPIVHLCSNKNDPVKEVMQKYDAGCILFQDDLSYPEFEKSVMMLHNNARKVSFAAIKHTYYDATPQYTADIIRNADSTNPIIGVVTEQ